MKAGMAIALWLCLLYAGSTTAQPTVVLPSTGDNTVANTGEPFNTAMINYGTGTTDVLWGIAFTGLDPIYVQDVAAVASATITPTGGGTQPDVIIGNSSTPGNYTMAVAYYNNGLQIEIDYYEISGAGTGSLSIVRYATSSYIGLSGTLASQGNNTVHLDLIAEHCSLCSFPSCHKFVVTWDDLNNGNVYAVNGDLSTHSVSLSTVTIDGGSEPDVAAVQRQLGSPASTHDLGLFTYINGVGDLKYRVYDFTVATLYTAATLDRSGDPIAVPRIDAIDDYVRNANPSIAAWKVAAQAAVTTGTVVASYVRTYDTLLLPSYFESSNNITISGFSGSLNHYSPVVALVDSDTYSVFHWTEEAPVASGADVAFNDPIYLKANDTLTGNKYYWVNSSSGTKVMSETITTNGAWLNAAASSVNHDTVGGNLSVYAWGELVSGNWVTKYKLSGAKPFAYREGTITNGTGSVAQQVWELYPNPATSVLNVRNATGADADSYHVLDVTGTEVMHGNVTGSSAAIDVGQLAPGSYLLKMMHREATAVTMKFMKQ